MKHAVFLIVFSFMLQDICSAQSHVTDIIFTNRAKRIVPLHSSENLLLKRLHNNIDSNIHIASIITNALFNKDVIAYTNVTDSNTDLTVTQVQQILTDTKEITNIDYVPSLCSHLVIYENWYVDKNTGNLKKDYIGFALAVRSYKDTAVFYPLFWIQAMDFIPICKDYYILINQKKVSLSDYIMERKFTSKVLSQERIKTEYNKDFYRELMK